MRRFRDGTASLRFAVAFCAAVVGGAVSMFDLAQAMSRLPPAQRGVAGQNSPEEDRLIFDACVTFYGAAYATGRAIYRMAGMHSEVVRLRRWSVWHMLVLNVYGCTWLLWPAFELDGVQGVFRASFGVALVMIGVSVTDCLSAFRRRSDLLDNSCTVSPF